MKEMTKIHCFHEKPTSYLTFSSFENNSYIPKTNSMKVLKIDWCVYTTMLNNVPIFKIIISSNPYGNFEKPTQFLNYYFSYFKKPSIVSTFDFF
jgi:hypothetical protein